MEQTTPEPILFFTLFLPMGIAIWGLIVLIGLSIAREISDIIAKKLRDKK